MVEAYSIEVGGGGGTYLRFEDVTWDNLRICVINSSNGILLCLSHVNYVITRHHSPLVLHILQFAVEIFGMSGETRFNKFGVAVTD